MWVLTLLWALPPYLLPDVSPGQSPTSGAGLTRAIASISTFFSFHHLSFLLLFLGVFPQLLQDALIHRQLGSDLPGDGGGPPAHGTDDVPLRSEERAQAALAEAVFTLKQTRTPPPRGVGPVTDSAVQICAHVEGWFQADSPPEVWVRIYMSRWGSGWGLKAGDTW